jgi:hypothetical protein
MRPRFTKTTKRWAIFAWILFALYVGSYLAISAGGCYEHKPLSSKSVEPFQWAPCGFVTEYRWNVATMRIYYFLWVLDRRLWHKDENAFSGVYPIDEPVDY